MKKALIVLLAFAMVGTLFADINADEPLGGAKIELSGFGKVTWGVDLVTNATGFQNDSEAKLKYTLVENDSAVSGADAPVYGEVKFKDVRVFSEAVDGESAVNARAKFDYAKIVAGAISVKVAGAPEISTNFENLDLVPMKIGKVGLDQNKFDYGTSGGVTVEYASDMIDFSVEVASKLDWTETAATIEFSDDVSAYAPSMIEVTEDDGSTYTAWYGLYKPTAKDAVAKNEDNLYAFAAAATVKPMDGLEAEIAFAMATEEDTDKGFGLSADYTMDLNETFKVVTGAGMDMVIGKDDNTIAIDGGARLGWAGTDGDKDKKMFDFVVAEDNDRNKIYSGVGAGVIYMMVGDEDPTLGLNVSAWEDGAEGMVPGLGLGVAYEAVDLMTDGDLVSVLRLYADYGIDNVTAFMGTNKNLTKDSKDLDLMAGVKVADVVPNVDMLAKYVSGAQLGEDDNEGTFTIECKVNF